MIAALGAVPWRLVGLAGGAVLLGVLWLRLEAVSSARDQARAQAAEAARVAATNARAVELLQLAHAESLRQVTEAAAAERMRLLSAAELKRRVADAPRTSSCGPAVAAALAGLRERAAPTAGGAGHAAGGAGGPADLPPGPTGAPGGR